MNRTASSRVLLLNNGYEAINICSLHRAMKLLFKDVAVIEEKNDFQICSANNSFDAPSVIRLRDYVYIPRRKVMLNRRNVFIRDKYVCQYCSKTFTAKDLTLDHVVPQSKGGPNTWENVVSACKKCNNKKDNKMLNNSGMTLIKKPSSPRSVLALHIYRHLGRNREEWGKYIFA